MASYKESGVDVEEGYRAVNKYKEHAKRTAIPGLLTGLGSFNGISIFIIRLHLSISFSKKLFLLQVHIHSYFEKHLSSQEFLYFFFLVELVQ